MRPVPATLLSLSAVLLIPVGVALAQAADERAPMADNLLTRYLDQANIHPPVEVGPLTVFPVSLNRANRLDNLLTMEQALSKKVLVVEELESAEVSQARFVNKSAREMIFLMAGEVITGGRQNRTLATDALLGPDSATVLPVYCVQKGRWEGKKDFTPDVTVAPQAVREQAARQAGQQEVWNEVSKANQRLNSSTDSDDLATAMEKPENRARLAELRKKVEGKLPRGCAGIVVARGGSMVGADLFNSPDLFEAMSRRVLDSYLSEYAMDDRAPPGRGERPDQDDVRRYLQGCYRSRFQAEDTRGIGEVFRVSGLRTGHTLGYRPRGPAADEYMIHTSLTQEAVPVRPRPEPPPRPIPPPRPVPLPEPQPQPRL